MKTKIFMKKEIKSIEIMKTLLVIVLITMMLGVVFIGEVGKMEKRFGLNIDGLFPLLGKLINNNAGVNELSILIINIGFIVPMIVYSVYIGFPYILSSYERSKLDGTLLHIMIMPIKVGSLVLKFALFSFIKTVIMSLSSFLLLSFPFFIIKPYMIVMMAKSNFFWSFFSIILIILITMIMMTSLLWIFNGNKSIIMIYRWAILGMLIIMMPLFRQVGFHFKLPNNLFFVFLVILPLVSLICFYLVEKYFNKEKVLLNL